MKKNQSLKSKMILIFTVLLSAFFTMQTTEVNASHFRFGYVTATRLSETTTTVTYRLNVSTSWALFSAPGITPFTFSGGNVGSVNVTMTNVTDPSGGWTNSTGIATITLNKSATLTRITSTSCCKISTLVNNRDRNWDVYVILNTNAPGSSPSSTSAAIINMPINAPAATAQISASDPDPGSTLTFGTPNLTSGNLAGLTLPSGWSINSSGLMTFNTVGKTVGQLYNTMVTVTDNNGNQIMLDLIIRMVGPSNPPVFDYSVTPVNNQVFNLTVGQNLNFPIRATDPDVGSTVSFSVAGLTSYITTANFGSAPLPATGNPAQTTFNYTPVVAQSGTQTVLNFIATDNVGVQTTSTVTINVIAQPAPVFIAPTPGPGTIRSILSGINQVDNIVASSSLSSNVSIAFATLPSGATTSPIVPTTGANPGSTTMNWTPTPSQFGSHTLNYTATISSTPTIFSTRSYNLIVNTLPVFTSSPVTTATDCNPYTYNVVATDANIPFGDLVDVVSDGPLPNWLTLTSTGNGTATLSGNPTTANVGTYTIKLLAEDAYHHNYSHVEQEFIITVVSCCTPPVISCPSTITVNNQSGQCGAIVSFVGSNAATATGTSPTITYSPASGSFFPVGTTTVTATANNSCGNVQCTFTVVVNDNQPPATPTLANVTGQCSATVTAPTTTDNCAGTITGTTTTVFPITTQGTTVVTWTFNDGNGNSTTANQSVIVANTTAPTPDALTLANATGQCSATIATAPTATGNCGNTITGTTNDALTRTTQGTSTVTWTFTDPNGNITTSQTQNIVVANTTAPTPDAPTLANATGQCSATITTAPTATGNCGNTITGTTNDALTRTTQGTSTVTWTFTDPNGNITTTQTQNMIVEDNTNPVITCPANTFVQYGNDEGPAANGTATATDNCTIVSVGIPTNTTVNGPGNNKTITRTWTATDIANNTATCNQTITVCDMGVSLGNNRYVFFGIPGSPGASGVLTATVSGGLTGVTYLWASTDVSVNGLTTQSVTPTGYTDAQAVTYTVTATAPNGCTATATVTITYFNVNCSNNGNTVKVKVCHIPQGNPTNCNTICVSINAYQTLLNNGSYLGQCLPNCALPPTNLRGSEDIEDYIIKPVVKVKEEDKIKDELFAVTVLNNPTAGSFILKVSGTINDKISIRIMDMNGMQVEQQTNLNAGQEIQIGSRYISGTYFAEITQGANRKVVKLVKLN